jgi:DeoR/GlpR family transcriptional regulator of sugar metabolism
MVDVERDMIAAADKVVLVIDHTKFNQRAVARLCEPTDIDMIITDDGLPPADRKWLGEHWRAELIIAPMAEENQRP